MKMKPKRNIKERTWATILQAIAAGAGTEGLSAAMPYFQSGEFQTGGKVLLFTVLMGLLAFAKSWIQNRMPARKYATDTED